MSGLKIFLIEFSNISNRHLTVVFFFFLEYHEEVLVKLASNYLSTKAMCTACLYSDALAKLIIERTEVSKNVPAFPILGNTI